MSIYTRKGDKGSTSLYGGRRVSKSIVRFEVLGCVDEANAIIGLVRSKLVDVDFKRTPVNKMTDSKSMKADLSKKLERIQGELFALGADIATPYSASTTFQKRIGRFSQTPTKQLEQEIDEMEKLLPELKNFILPGGNKAAALLQLARAVVRRAERNVVRLGKGAKVNLNTLKYLNRLSDWLFICARLINFYTDEKETIWQ